VTIFLDGLAFRSRRHHGTAQNARLFNAMK